MVTLTLTTNEKEQSISVPVEIGNLFFDNLSKNNKTLNNINFADFQEIISMIISSSVDLNSDETKNNINAIIESKISNGDDGTSEITIKTENLQSNKHHTDDLIKSMSEQGMSLVKNVVQVKGRDTTSKMEFVMTKAPRTLFSNTIFKTPVSSRVSENPDIQQFLVISDIHAPYHDKALVNNLVDYGISNKFFGCIINGDILDLPYFGHYDKDMAYFDMKTQAETVNEMGELCDRISEHYEFKMLIDGNHDQRMSRDAIGKGITGVGLKPYKSNYDLFSVATYLNLGRHQGQDEWKNFTVLPYGASTQIGSAVDGLRIHHGNKFGKNINPDMIKSNTLYGHTHRLETKIGCRMADNGIVVNIAEYRTGCLLDFTKEIPCMSDSIKDNWNNGFAIVTHEVSTGKVFVDNILITNGKFFFNGEIVDLYARQ